GEAARIRFAVEEVKVLLPHKERCAIDWVGSVACFIITDSNCGCARRTQRSPGHIAQYDGEALIPFCVTIVHQWNGNRLRGFPGREADGFNRGRIVAARRGPM